MPLKKPPIKLARPGAGLPFFQHLAARYIILPRFFRKTPWEQAQEMFEKEGQKILKRIEGLSLQDMATQVLVNPIQGLEDSSRFWSIAMSMEHLIVVGRLMLRAMKELTHGTVPAMKVGTADVKPLGALSAKNAIESFREFQEEFLRESTSGMGDRGSKLKSPHPWFGPLTAHRWLCVAALHQRIHRQQVELILQGLAQNSTCG